MKNLDWLVKFSDLNAPYLEQDFISAVSRLYLFNMFWDFPTNTYIYFEVDDTNFSFINFSCDISKVRFFFSYSAISAVPLAYYRFSDKFDCNYIYYPRFLVPIFISSSNFPYGKFVNFPVDKYVKPSDFSSFRSFISYNSLTKYKNLFLSLPKPFFYFSNLGINHFYHFDTQEFFSVDNIRIKFAESFIYYDLYLLLHKFLKELDSSLLYKHSIYSKTGNLDFYGYDFTFLFFLVCLADFLGLSSLVSNVYNEKIPLIMKTFYISSGYEEPDCFKRYYFYYQLVEELLLEVSRIIGGTNYQTDNFIKFVDLLFNTNLFDTYGNTLKGFQRAIIYFVYYMTNFDYSNYILGGSINA